ncbi:hypothetical protein EHO57_14000 [Leptospira langatensis]|uniref:Uncharacterized protein n=1 Tax=Leptospira langatensis TaxID=2484983 RepID=A0A5R2AST1_9LEPT|nr:hypothetical protein [Leptospira langatensis]TGJ99868.1 hypothetical protein EHO57_14000 [Leptospira langatensis]
MNFDPNPSLSAVKNFVSQNKTLVIVLGIALLSYIAGRIHATHNNAIECDSNGIIIDPINFGK